MGGPPAHVGNPAHQIVSVTLRAAATSLPTLAPKSAARTWATRPQFMDLGEERSHNAFALIEGHPATRPNAETEV